MRGGIMTSSNNDGRIIPRIVTADQLRAVASVDPIYAAGVQVMLKRGLWKLNTEKTSDGGV